MKHIGTTTHPRTARTKWIGTVTAIALGAAVLASCSSSGSSKGSGTTTSTPTSASTTTAPTAATTAPTPTTVPGPPNTKAVSASFVSASHGWALERDGAVGETNDGGATWHRVGSLGVSGSNMKIRFADAMHGFAFTLPPNQGAPVWSTVEGGGHWQHLDTPFSSVFDLAISHGVVYVVAQQGNGDFRIWSAPAATLSWSEQPLVIHPGAGPVPAIQLVLAGTSGWVVEVDRTVVGGARMSATGTWSAWTPPCTKVNGPAFLAAWGPTDLIATCDEGVWGSPPPRAAAVYTSHDAGATFLRYAAPVFGAVAAADPNYAVIVDGNTIRRSIDGGRTWKLVVRVTIPNAVQPLDLGFTTDTQGFAIFPDGEMLMTRDSGGTWNPETLP